MQVKTILIGFMVVVAAIVLVALLSNPSEPEDSSTTPEDANDVVTEVSSTYILNQLPHSFSVAGRSITVDRDSIEPTEREEYAALPYEVAIGDETRLVEATTVPEPGETPLDFTERFVSEIMPPAEELAMYGDNMYEYTASIHPLSETDLAEHPASDDGTAGTASDSVSIYVRAMNFPDDSIGGNEQRLDYIVTESDEWVLVWHGERNFCRRPDQEFWQPADQLCP